MRLPAVRIITIILICFLPSLLFAQDPETPVVAEISAFRGFSLGLGIDAVKELLKKDVSFNYRGDPDVYFLPKQEQQLIECSGNAFIKRAYFQFVDQKLFSLILDLDDTKVDFYSMLVTFQDKYGAYLSFSPQAVVWEVGNTRLSLEKPLTVKYIDKAVFNILKDAGKAVLTSESQTLRDFLAEF